MSEGKLLNGEDYQVLKGWFGELALHKWEPMVTLDSRVVRDADKFLGDVRALFDEIEVLRREIAELGESRDGWAQMAEDEAANVLTLAEQVKDKDREIEALVETVAWYGDEGNYQDTEGCVLDDDGERAYQCLKRLGLEKRAFRMGEEEEGATDD